MHFTNCWVINILVTYSIPRVVYYCYIEHFLKINLARLVNLGGHGVNRMYNMLGQKFSILSKMILAYN